MATSLDPGVTVDTAKLEIGSRDKSVGWYMPTLESITDAQRDLLEKYSKIAPERVISHLFEIRDQGWEIWPHPCIGQFRFMDLSMMRTPSYQNIISRLKSGASILDLGCCVAQDLRKLVHDGAPSTNMYGADLHGKFLALGYDLFLDKETFGAKFMEADVFDLESPLKDLEGKVDIIHIGLFLHVFDLEGQIKACERIVSLARPVNGTLVVGQQTGKPVAGNQPTRRGNTFKHNVETFENMWRVVGEKTGTRWEVRAKMDEGLGVADKNRTWDDPSIRRLAFEVERIG